MLKGFFSNLKSLDDYIEFGMLTGVARFNKVSIFSELNNLNDISMYEQFQEICGWTEEELTSRFRTGIEDLQDHQALLVRIRNSDIHREKGKEIRDRP